MSWLGLPEVAALACDWKHERVCGVRLRPHAHHVCEVVKYASAVNEDWVHAANTVLKELGVNRSVYLIVAALPECCESFVCQLPKAPAETLREALRFEVPRSVMSVPEKYKLQYTVCAEDAESGMLKVRCAVFPEEYLQKFCNKLISLRNKVDVLMNPLLALPAELNSEDIIQLAEFENDFCWQNNNWLLRDGENSAACNKHLDEILQYNCHCKYTEDDNPAIYRTAMMTALFGMRKLAADSQAQAGMNILPDFLRPARFRTQLRLLVVLLVLVLGVNIFRYGGGFVSRYQEHSKISAQIKNARSKVQNLRKKVKSGDREIKELQKVADLQLGSRECLGYLGYLSDKLPDNVLLSNYRWNEGSIDMNLQTTAQDLDLVSFFNRLPGFKVVSANQRTNPGNNLTNANIKLSVEVPGGKTASKKTGGSR